MPLAHFRNIETANPAYMMTKCEKCTKIGIIYTYDIDNKKEFHIFCIEHKEEFDKKYKF